MVKIYTLKEIVDRAYLAIKESGQNSQLTGMAGNEIRRAQDHEFDRNIEARWHPVCYVNIPTAPITLKYDMENWLHSNNNHRWREAFNMTYFAFEDMEDAKKFCLYWTLKV